MSIRILFVDDEPLILDGLQRSLRPFRKEWTAAYAAGGEEALAMLEREPFDVIVTDMRMPGMDGAMLLGEVTRRYPDVLRMVLSGQSDLESVVKSAGAAHQYLTKPCSVQVLRDAVNRTVALRQLLTNASLKQVVSRMRSIPSVPPLYVELTNCLKSRDGSLEKASAIIQKDMGMSAKVLQLANSGLFGSAGRIGSTKEAVTYLGLDTIRTLLLSLHAFSEFKPPEGPSNFCMQSLWSHSLLTGTLAERIIQSLPASANADIDMRTHRTAARYRAPGARRQPAGELRTRVSTGRGEGHPTLGGRARRVWHNACRSGRLPVRVMGFAGVHRGSRGLPPLALQMPSSRTCHVDGVACRRYPFIRAMRAARRFRTALNPISSIWL